MQTLQVLIRNLAIVLLIATFLEMLLPNKSMRGFVQLIMGLFVISAVLTPITDILNTPLELEIPAWTSIGTSNDLPVLASEGNEKQIGRTIVTDQFRKILTHQIEALALGVKGVKEAKAEVAFEEDEGGLTEQPRILSVKIMIFSSELKISPVKPIVIGDSLPPPAETSRAEEVRNRVSALMELPQEKITVYDEN